MPLLPRPYQSENVQRVIAAHVEHQSVLEREATGLGKAVEIALLSAHYVKAGRALILVDVRKLVTQLAATIEWVTEITPGIEMAESRASHAGSSIMASGDSIVVACVQSMYSGNEGYERYRRFDPTEFSLLVLDECELFLAEKARQVVDYFARGNPKIRVAGYSATPFRTDDVAMANLFTHVAVDRDILWGIEQGYLVPGRQAFVRVSVDFSSLKIRKSKDADEGDYSDNQIAERLQSEQVLIELAKGIHHVAEDRKSIVVAPNVLTAKAISNYLNGERDGCSDVVYGEMSDEQKDRVMEGHQRGDFQFLCSVMMLTKGYDDPSIRAVFNCRKTRSKRLYQQILGRGTRPLKLLAEELGRLNDSASRRALIAASAKPDMIMANLVGIADSVLDITLIDILGEELAEDIRNRAKEIEQSEEVESEVAIAQAQDEFREQEELEEEADRLRMQAESTELEEAEEREIARQRQLIQVDARIDVDFQDGLGGRGSPVSSPSGVSPGQLSILKKAKFTDAEISRMNAQEIAAAAREIFRRWNKRLCSHRQAAVLHRAGYSEAETRNMKTADASAAIEACKANGWRRPSEMGVA